MGHAETAGLARHGPGKGPLGVAEEFALQESLRQGPAVNLNEGAPRAMGGLMDGLGHHIFARARLAGDEDGDIALGEEGQGLKNFLHLLAATDDPFEAEGLVFLVVQLPHGP